MGLNARKPVFCGLPTTKGQTSLCICADRSAPLLITFWKVSYLSEIFIFYLVSVAEETGLSLPLSETPKTGFVASM